MDEKDEFEKWCETEMDKVPATSTRAGVLMECLAEYRAHKAVLQQMCAKQLRGVYVGTQLNSGQL